MLLVSDNYDSFTYNLVQYLGELGEQLEVRRNDKTTVAEIEQLAPEAIVISPGPCTPKEAGISKDVIRSFSGRVPLLGVCLGHQCIGEAFGGVVNRADRLMHGKVSPIFHTGDGLFEGIENPFVATRYHSLIIEPDTLGDEFEVSAWCNAPDGSREIMGICHKEFPLFGMQFHPESFLTDCGTKLLERFLEVEMN